MKHQHIRRMVFLALCCNLGLFSKRLVSPLANVITGALHIPGGVSTSFYLMFLVIAAALVPGRHCGAMMGAAQSGLALALGMTGSMGALAPIGYIIPGIAVDLSLYAAFRLRLDLPDRMALANAAAAVTAAFTANAIAFHLRGAALALYLGVSLSTGILCGLLGAKAAERLLPIAGAWENKPSIHRERVHDHEKEND